MRKTCNTPFSCLKCPNIKDCTGRGGNTAHSAEIEANQAVFPKHYLYNFRNYMFEIRTVYAFKQCTLLQGGCKSKNQCLQILIKYTFLYFKLRIALEKVQN